MQGQGQETPSANVVSLFGNRQKAAQSAATTDEAEKTSADEQKGESFLDVMTRNAKNAERMAKERANANKSVLRSYRIKT